MNVRSQVNNESQTISVIIDIATNELDTKNPKAIIYEAIDKAVNELANTYVQEHKSEILAAVNPIAVANLAIADSAKLVREQFIDPGNKKNAKRTQD